jgi:hypothetical protein
MPVWFRCAVDELTRERYPEIPWWESRTKPSPPPPSPGRPRLRHEDPPWVIAERRAVLCADLPAWLVDDRRLIAAIRTVA